jgi:hypothetical protein
MLACEASRGIAKKNWGATWRTKVNRIGNIKAVSVVLSLNIDAVAARGGVCGKCWCQVVHRSIDLCFCKFDSGFRFLESGSKKAGKTLLLMKFPTSDVKTRSLINASK